MYFIQNNCSIIWGGGSGDERVFLGKYIIYSNRSSVSVELTLLVILTSMTLCRTTGM